MTPRVIDTKMHGYSGVTAAFLVAADRVALVETGPRTTVDNVVAALDAAGVGSLDFIVVTHIHLDHAGAAGTLAARYPEATVCVHEAGAPHLVNPTKLWASAGRIYGNAMEALWGGIDPIPPHRIRALADGDEIDLGGRRLRAFDTPGHARHHHVFLDDATGGVFAGDALGVRLADADVVRPATPPPEFDLAAAIASIRRIADLDPSSLWFTHYGPSDAGVAPIAPGAACDAAIDALQTWESWVREARARTDDLDETAALVARAARAAAEGTLADHAILRLEQTTSYRMNVWGYLRYLDRSGRA